MNKLVFSFLLLFAFNNVSAQKQSLNIGGGIEMSFEAFDEEGNGIHLLREEMPEFPGGIDSLYSFLTNNLEYPKSAIEDSISGKVITLFKVDNLGKVSDIRNQTSVRKDLDSTCIKTLQKMPDWLPLTQYGNRKVIVLFALPINFILVIDE